MSAPVEWTPEQTERLLALVAVGEPFWVPHVERMLLSLGQVRHADRLFGWTIRRAVRLYRAAAAPSSVAGPPSAAGGGTGAAQGRRPLGSAGTVQAAPTSDSGRP